MQLDLCFLIRFPVQVKDYFDFSPENAPQNH